MTLLEEKKAIYFKGDEEDDIGFKYYIGWEDEEDEEN